MKINIKTLILTICLGLVIWILGFFVVGSAIFMGLTGQAFMQWYIMTIIINSIIVLGLLIVFFLYVEKKNPLSESKWWINAILIGAIICALQFILDIIVMGAIFGMNLHQYFFFQSTVMIFYPLTIPECVILAYFITKE